MAYDKTKLVQVSGGYSELPHTFEYTTAETITTAGYFPKDCGIRGGDMVVKIELTKVGNVVSAREDTVYYITNDENGTLTAVAAE